MAKCTKFLLISLYRLGDNIQATPILEALRRKNPQADISVLTQKGYELFFRDNPNIDRLSLFHRDQYKGSDFASPGTLRKALKPDLTELCEQEFDLLINRQSSRDGAVLAGMIPAKEKRGLLASDAGAFTTPDPWSRLLFAMVSRRRLNPFHLVEYGLRIAGAEPDQACPFVATDPESVSGFAETARGGAQNRLVAIQPGSSTPYRQWPVEEFSKFTDLLLSGYPETRIVLLGSPDEKPLVEQIETATDPHNRHRIFQSWHLPLASVPSLLAQCDLMITNDTGPMHIAEAVGCPTLSLHFGGSLVCESAPYTPGNVALQGNIDCLPCSESQACPRQFRCKKLVEPSPVAALAGWMLKLRERPSTGEWGNAIPYRSERDPLSKAIAYFPLERVPLRTDDLVRTLFAAAFRKKLLNEDTAIPEILSRLSTHYTGVAELVSGPFDMDMAPVNNFARSKVEAQDISQQILQVLECFRGHLGRAESQPPQ